MKLLSMIGLVAVFVLSNLATAKDNVPASADFSYDQTRLATAKPWTSKRFQNDSNEFQFVIIGDRTGGANAQGTFNLAVDQLNLLQPEFVINVGDAIEGYSDDKAKLNAEWDEFDRMVEKLNMPFFRTPGNHDIANEAYEAPSVFRTLPDLRPHQPAGRSLPAVQERIGNMRSPGRTPAGRLDPVAASPAETVRDHATAEPGCRLPRLDPATSRARQGSCSAIPERA